MRFNRYLVYRACFKSIKIRLPKSINRPTSNVLDLFYSGLTKKAELAKNF